MYPNAAVLDSVLTKDCVQDGLLQCPTTWAPFTLHSVTIIHPGVVDVVIVKHLVVLQVWVDYMCHNHLFLNLD